MAWYAANGLPASENPLDHDEWEWEDLWEDLFLQQEPAVALFEEAVEEGHTEPIVDDWYPKKRASKKRATKKIWGSAHKTDPIRENDLHRAQNRREWRASKEEFTSVQAALKAEPSRGRRAKEHKNKHSPLRQGLAPLEFDLAVLKEEEGTASYPSYDHHGNLVVSEGDVISSSPRLASARNLSSAQFCTSTLEFHGFLKTKTSQQSTGIM